LIPPVRDGTDCDFGLVRLGQVRYFVFPASWISSCWFLLPPPEGVSCLCMWLPYFLLILFMLLLGLVTWRENVYLENFTFHCVLLYFWVHVCKIYFFRCSGLLILARYLWWCILLYFGQFLLEFLGSSMEGSRCFRNVVFILIICDNWISPGECWCYYLHNHSSIPCTFKKFFCSPENSTGSGFWSTSHAIHKTGYYLGDEAAWLWSYPLILQ
jgi:hypothetical protein